ncbi:hypothetical protein MP228_011310 [Amoeboaphelidium protococcarum]|nr:hypothetical protein MP228_011310 [Amoeboaphelidium protococcarum]
MSNSKNVFKEVTAEEVRNAERTLISTLSCLLSNGLRSSMTISRRKMTGIKLKMVSRILSTSQMFFLSVRKKDGNEFKAESLKFGIRAQTRVITAEMPRDVVNFETDPILTLIDDIVSSINIPT